MYREYFNKHPEEYERIQALKDFSHEVDEALKRRQEEKLKKVEYYRRLFNEQSSC